MSAKIIVALNTKNPSAFVFRKALAMVVREPAISTAAPEKAAVSL